MNLLLFRVARYLVVLSKAKSVTNVAELLLPEPASVSLLHPILVTDVFSASHKSSELASPLD